jgi:hypothetical protein
MAFVLRFTPKGMTATKYDEVIERLKSDGAGAPKGRSYHVCFGDPENLFVSDIWDSMEDFQAFGKTLLPIMQSMGLDAGEPAILKVHNVITG